MITVVAAGLAYVFEPGQEFTYLFPTDDPVARMGAHACTYRVIDGAEPALALLGTYYRPLVGVVSTSGGMAGLYGPGVPAGHC